MLLASAGGGAALWIVLWIVSIALGIALYRASPVFPGMDAKAARARTGMLVMGFLPCYGINIISVLMMYGYYRLKAGSPSEHAELQKRFQNPTIAPPPPPTPGGPAMSGGNPFVAGGEASPPQTRPGPSPDNPFT